MLTISEKEITERLRFDNPWWEKNAVGGRIISLPRRFYFDPFYQLATDRSVNRAIILLGPRRVGKTVMVQQMLQAMIKDGNSAQDMLYLSLETPIYTGIGLEQLLKLFLAQFQHKREHALTVVFDEIQYLRDWEVHLKSLVDSYPSIRFIATGSAAAALRLKSRESGAGRFTEFLLPPLTFAEYIEFIGKSGTISKQITEDNRIWHQANDIADLNADFVDYLNFGGYPEAVFSPTVREDSARFIKSDIIDKVLLRDLPGLYGIQDIQELNRLFTVLAYNTGNEVSLEGLSQSSGVAKNTLKRYIEYLEAAFLIRRVVRIDQNARHFRRASAFKVYLTNPSMRAALFGPVDADDSSMGHLAETAIYSQWFHQQDTIENLHYARWSGGEVDIVACARNSQKPWWLVEIKWSDEAAHEDHPVRHVIDFSSRHRTMMDPPLITTRTIRGERKVAGVLLRLAPCAEYALTVGKNVLTQKSGPSAVSPAKLKADRQAELPLE